MDTSIEVLRLRAPLSVAEPAHGASSSAAPLAGPLSSAAVAGGSAPAATSPAMFREAAALDLHVRARHPSAPVPPSADPRPETPRAATHQREMHAPEAPQPVSLPRALAWRLFDMALALALIVFTLPVLAALALCILAGDPGPIFFAHRRIGKGGREFFCLKFRTMRLDADRILEDTLRRNPQARREWEETRKLRCDPRVTPIGALLRKLSLDELPQLINILRGEMSIVGPRPIVAGEVVRYGPYFEHYCHVRPGLTGLWQTSGRSDTSYGERVALDVAYVARKGIALDSLLVCKTVPAVMLARGSY